MMREYIVKTIAPLVAGMDHEEFESFCEREDLPIFVIEDGKRFTIFNTLRIMEI